VDRAVRVLRTLAGAELRLTDIARALGLPKSTTLAILQTLAAHALVTYDDGARRYALGPALVALAGAAQARNTVARAARPYLERLAEQTGETVILHVPDDGGSVILDREESPHQLRVTAPLGLRLPPFAGAVAKALLAWLPEKEVRRRLGARPLPAFTSRSITAPAAYIRELRRVRRQGVARDDEEYLPGVRAVSAPIRASGRAVATISVVGVKARFTRARMRRAADLVRRAAEQISWALAGGSPATDVAVPGGGSAGG
jgi:IclR family acetate operon transcriptional repressor